MRELRRAQQEMPPRQQAQAEDKEGETEEWETIPSTQELSEVPPPSPAARASEDGKIAPGSPIAQQQDMPEGVETQAASGAQPMLTLAESWRRDRQMGLRPENWLSLQTCSTKPPEKEVIAQRRAERRQKDQVRRAQHRVRKHRARDDGRRIVQLQEMVDR